MFSVNNILSENNSNIQQNIIISIMSHTRVIRSLRTLMLCVHILNSFRKKGGLKYFYVRLSAEKKKKHREGYKTRDWPAGDPQRWSLSLSKAKTYLNVASLK